MAKYYFRLLGPGQPVISDEESQEFASIEAAKLEAVELISDIRADDALYGSGPVGRFLEITDESGQLLDSIPFSNSESRSFSAFLCDLAPARNLF